MSAVECVTGLVKKQIMSLPEYLQQDLCKLHTSHRLDPKAAPHHPDPPLGSKIKKMYVTPIIIIA